MPAVTTSPLRASAAALLTGLVLAPGHAGAADTGMDAAVACAQPALQDQLRSRYPLATVGLHALREPASGAPAEGAGLSDCSVRAVDPALRRRMGVVVDCRDGAGRAQPRRVLFEVDARMAALRLKDGTRPDSALRADQLEAAEADLVADPDALSADAQPPVAGHWRLRQELPAGHLLRRTDVVPANSVLRGDTVNLVYRSGAVVLQVPGQALSPAAPGQSLRVAVAGQREPVSGLLGDARLVEVQP